MLMMEKGEGGEGGGEKKGKLDLDWKLIYPTKPHEDPPPEIQVVVSVGESEEEELSAADAEIYAKMTDRELSDKLQRIEPNFKTLSAKLSDKGAKLQRQILLLHREQDRRKTQIGSQKKADETEKSTQSQKSYSLGSPCNGIVSKNPSSQVCPQSVFGACFSQVLEEKKPECCTTGNAFSSDLHHLGHNNHQKKRANGMSFNKLKRETSISSRQSPFRAPKLFRDDKHRASNGAEKVSATSSFCHPRQKEILSSCSLKRRKTSEVQTSMNLRPRKNQTVVDLDEEDCQLIRTTEQEDEQVGGMATIYFPSRDDPESVELCYSDIKCLAPETFLSSTIMNFYIRYLQRPESATGRSQRDYHFFNTYFYGKLKEAVSYKGNDKETFFSKFRRWWKGVNIFQKAYILLPIHETQHWSLVIICIPDMEDESGPIMLHLDSLGFHPSSQIFQNVRSFLKEEWMHQNGAAPPDVPFTERIWKNLPRRIEDKIITVPQQKNDYDCGIFVLYFMERFIQEAPDRLKKQDLTMFSRQWFKPEEASGLRKRIRRLLEEEFANASIENENEDENKNESRESSPASSGDDPVRCTGDTSWKKCSPL